MHAFLKKFMIMIFVLLTLSCQEKQEKTSPSYKQPNIVFLFTDDHAVQAIGAFGSKINKTPHLDRLAKSGMIFNNSFCANSICGPSRACILTGKHSHKNGFMMNGNKFNGDQMTFPKLLKKQGYQTALIGKWHLHTNPQGFDHWEILPGQGSYYNPTLYSAPGRYKVDGSSNLKRYQGYVTDIVTDIALEWLNKRDQNKPFMLMCQHKAPHRTWCPPLKYLTKYDDVDIPEPETLFDDYENRSPTLKKNSMSIDKHFYYDYDLFIHGIDVPFASKREKELKSYEYRRMDANQKKQWDAAYGPKNKKFLANPPKGKDLVRWKYQRYIKNYIRCIDSVDDNVGRVLDYLEKNNLRDNTIVIYSSDQGFYLGEHGWYDKRWMFEESLKMPLIVSWPGTIKPNSVCNKLVQNIDYAPTFLEIAGAQSHKSIQGMSMIPLFKDSEAKWRDAIYYHYYEHGGEHNVPRHEGVRDDRYKLINFYSNDGYNLFDLKEDPQEMKNVYGQLGYQDIGTKMKGKLKALRLKYDCPPLKNKK